MMIDNLSFQEPVVPKSIMVGKSSTFGEFSAFFCCVSQNKRKQTSVPTDDTKHTADSVV